MTPVSEVIKSSSSAERISDIPVQNLKDIFSSDGFKLEEALTQPQMIHQDNLLSPLEQKQTIAVKILAGHNRDEKDKTIPISPLEYAGLKGNKFMIHVLLAYPKIRGNEAVIQNALRLAIMKVNLGVIDILLSQLSIKDPLSIFHFALNEQHYFDPERQFAVIRLLLDQKTMSGVPHAEMGKAFIKFHSSKNLKMSAILFRAIKKRVLEKVQMHTDVESFRKFIVNEFFGGVIKVLDPHYWSFLLRPFAPVRPVLEKTKTLSSVDEKVPANVSPLDEEAEVKDVKETKEGSYYYVCNHLEQTLGRGKLFLKIHGHLKLYIGNIFQGLLDGDITKGDTDQLLLDKCFTSFDSQPANLRQGIAFYKQMNNNRIAKYLAKMALDQVTGLTPFDMAVNTFLLSDYFLQKTTIATDEDRRLLGRINFMRASLHLQMSHLTLAKKYFKIADKVFHSIQNPNREDTKYSMYMEVIDFATQFRGSNVAYTKTIYLNFLDYYQTEVEKGEMGEEFIVEYMGAVKDVKGYERSESERLSIHLNIVTLFLRDMGKPIMDALEESDFKLYKEALFAIPKAIKDGSMNEGQRRIFTKLVADVVKKGLAASDEIKDLEKMFQKLLIQFKKEDFQKTSVVKSKPPEVSGNRNILMPTQSVVVRPGQDDKKSEAISTRISLDEDDADETDLELA